MRMAKKTVGEVAAPLTAWVGGEVDAGAGAALESECLARLTPLVASGFLRLAAGTEPPAGWAVPS